MKVTLLNSYPDESVAHRAAGICIGKQGSETGMKSALSQGHMSIIEHLPCTFLIEGITRNCSHQLVRHRLASYSQMSLRYVELTQKMLDEIKKYFYMEYDDFWIKDKYSYDENSTEIAAEIYNILNKYIPVLTQSEFEEKKYKENFQYITYILDKAKNLINSLEIYLASIKDGMNFEDARDYLPSSFKTNIIMTCNARSLVEICKERLCEQAQLEIRTLFSNMKECIKDVYPTVYSYCKPKCAYSKCIETRPCSRKGNLTKQEQSIKAKWRG